MDLLKKVSNFFESSELTKDDLEIIYIPVVGSDYYQNNFKNYINKIKLQKNIDYVMEQKSKFSNIVYEYRYIPSLNPKLVKEPKNPQDPNAVYVSVSYGPLSFKLGYVASEETELIHKYLNQNRIYGIDLRINGGKSKIIDDDTVYNDESNYHVYMNILVRKLNI